MICRLSHVLVLVHTASQDIFELQITKSMLTRLPSSLLNPVLSFLPPSLPTPHFQKPVLIAVRFMSITRTATPVRMPPAYHSMCTSNLSRSSVSRSETVRSYCLLHLAVELVAFVSKLVSERLSGLLFVYLFAVWSRFCSVVTLWCWSSWDNGEKRQSSVVVSGGSFCHMNPQCESLVHTFFYLFFYLFIYLPKMPPI